MFKVVPSRNKRGRNIIILHLNYTFLPKKSHFQWLLRYLQLYDFFWIICTVQYRKNPHSWILKHVLQQHLLVYKYPEDRNKVSFIFICPTASAIAPNTVLNKWGKLKRPSTDHHQWSSSMIIISSLRNSSVCNNKNKHPQLYGHEFEQAPGVGNRQGSLVCFSPWGHKESDTTKRLSIYWALHTH